MIFIKNELNYLLEDYRNCENSSIKELILQDINLLKEALAILQQNEQDSYPIN
ncbi:MULTISPECIES: hypothetical protein [unclassified Bacillus (in: firmicutes)]|uniref:hypothetical protein n=1 Tax=unclassified Bacillus (in: firmicutes) TaxID=185979 RepID=UPI000A6FAB15|nr:MULTISPECIES: hypothetical protein [unclassified Bacillus (in: firmicutes)]MDF2066119.1 hypothetical protein [Bacillus sp. Cr_A10]